MSDSAIYKSADALVSARLAAAFEAWKRSAAGRIAPRREEITQALRRDSMPWIWMIDVVDEGRDFRFRIAGDRIVQFMGRRYAGLLLSSHLDGPFFARMRDILLECMRRRAPVAMGPLQAQLGANDGVKLEVIVTPLSEDGENITCLFGALDMSGQGGSAGSARTGPSWPRNRG